MGRAASRAMQGGQAAKETGRPMKDGPVGALTAPAREESVSIQTQDGVASTTLLNPRLTSSASSEKSARARPARSERTRAEFARHADHAILVRHVGLLLGREAGDDAAHMLRAAAAAAHERHAARTRTSSSWNSRHSRVSTGRSRSYSSLARIVSARMRTCSHSGWSSRVWSRSRPSSPSGRCWSEEAAGDVAGIVHREPHQARDLLGLGEEALRRLGQARAFQRHDALVALLGRHLVEGDGEIALAEQPLQRRQRRVSASRSGSKRT
jgi:hypothetical protein